MQTLSTTILIGRIGNDPETKAVGDKKVTNFSLATEQTWKDDKGEKKSETEWHNIELWGHENLLPYLKKGNPIHITGHNKTTSYEKTIGTEKPKFYRTVVVASEIGLLDSASK